MMVNTKEVEHGGMEVAYMDGVLSDVVAEIIGLAVVHAALDTSSGQPA